MILEKLLYPQHPVRCIITGPSKCGKSVSLTNLILIFLTNIIKYTSTHQASSRFLSKIN